jgi:hypothetical protein
MDHDRVLVFLKTAAVTGAGLAQQPLCHKIGISAKNLVKSI